MQSALSYAAFLLTILAVGCASDKAAPPEPDEQSSEISTKPQEKGKPDEAAPPEPDEQSSEVSTKPQEKSKSQDHNDRPDDEQNPLSFIHEDFVAAIVIRPNRASTSQLMSDWLVSEPEIKLPWEDVSEELGVDLDRIDELIFLFDRDSLQFPIGTPLKDPDRMPALIVRVQEGFKRLVDIRPFIFTEEVREKTFKGKRYHVGGQTALHFFAKRSYLLTSEQKLKKMISTESSDNRLASELSRIGVENDVVVALDLPAIDDKLKFIANAKPISSVPEAAAILKGLSKTETLSIIADLTKRPLVRMSLANTDDRAARNLQKDASSFVRAAQALLSERIRAPQTSTTNKALDAVFQVVERALGDLQIEATDNRLTLELQTRHAELPNVMEPVFQVSKEFRKRQRQRVKMIRISLGFFNTSANKMRARAIADSQGRPLLSWRVALLPQIDCRELYEKFHLDEPWDSPHNKPLIAEMPESYRFADDPKNGRTRILAVVGKEAAFDVKVPPVGEDELEYGFEALGRTESEFEDGKAGTLVLVVVGPDKAVPWTKPEDFSLDSPNPIDELGTLHGDTFWAMMRDMSPRRLPSDIDEKTLKALATIAGGEQIDPEIALDDEEFAQRLRKENARPHRSLDVARKLEALGVAVKIDEERRIHSVEMPEDIRLPEGETVDEALSLLKELPDLKSLSLSGTRVSPPGFAHLADLKNLESLDANHCGFTDETAKHLRGLTSLVHLNLAGNPITDEALHALENMHRLESLDLEYIKPTGRGLTGEGFQYLPSNSKLRSIGLDEAPLTEEGMKQLGRIRSLQELSFSDSTVGDSGLAHLASLPALKIIRLTRTRITDRALEHLGKISSLESLYLSDSNIDGSGLVHLIDLPRLEELDLSETPLDADEAVEHIAKMSELKSLMLTECRVKDAHVAKLLSLNQLKALGLGETQITDESMGVLVKLPKLDTLFVAETKVTSQSVQEFEKLKPNCFVSD